MTFKTTMKSALNALANHFNVFATDLPSGQIRRDMEAEGWKFGLLRHPYRASLTTEFAITPQGRPAIGVEASEQDRELLQNTINLKKRQLAL